MCGCEGGGAIKHVQWPGDIEEALLGSRAPPATLEKRSEDETQRETQREENTFQRIRLFPMSSACRKVQATETVS